MKLSAILSLIFIGLTTYARAAAPDPVAAVYNDLANHGLKNVATYNFVVTETRNGESQFMYRVTRIGPSQTRNLLLSVDGKPSNEKEIRAFTLERDNYSDDPNAPMKRGDMNRWIVINRIEETIVPGSLVLKETIGDQSYYVFKARTAVGGSAPVDLDGMLVYNATDNLVNTIEFTSSNVIESPLVGKIESFRLRMTYEKNKVMGTIVPLDLSWTVAGQKGSFSKFNEIYSGTFGDYRKGSAQ
jgi:hypothetical protein